MSLGAKVVRTAYKLTGMKKMFSLPEDRLMEIVEKMNRNRGFYMPGGNKFIYSKRMIFDKYPCLTIQLNETPSERAILFFFGGGMVIGPDKGDVGALQKLCAAAECDAWFPFYPLCPEHYISETYEMCYECYKEMCAIYGGNVSTCGFSSGGMLALGMAAHNSAMGTPLPQPRTIVAVSPGECPWNDAERERMKELNASDVGIDYNFMESVETFMRSGHDDVPSYMLSGSRGDYTGVGSIHFFYSSDEVLYGALPDYEAACKRSNVPYTVTARPGMVHCYCMLPYFKEAKEDFNKIAQLLKRQG